MGLSLLTQAMPRDYSLAIQAKRQNSSPKETLKKTPEKTPKATPTKTPEKTPKKTPQATPTKNQSKPLFASCPMK